MYRTADLKDGAQNRKYRELARAGLILDVTPEVAAELEAERKVFEARKLVAGTDPSRRKK